MISVDGILYSGKYCYVVDIVCVQPNVGGNLFYCNVEY